MRAVVVRQHANVAELAQERTDARNFQHPTVVALIGRIKKRTIEAARPGHSETISGFDDLWPRLFIGECFEKLRKSLFTVADKDVIEHRELCPLARLVERPGDRAPDYERSRRITLAQTRMGGDDRFVILI